MKILLDSHTLIWFLNGDRKCSPRARAAIEAPEAISHVSAASVWEIATKVRLGKWPEAAAFAANVSETLDENGLVALPVTVEHGRMAGFLPGAHRDPFDRMLAAQAVSENMTLLTGDPAFEDFNVRVIW